ncbi:hypothetical protein RFI_06457 [Reticulomyxa filosa]|uniref:RZ-type domain-containing protein n=1 Tax=Reticulomyxa filosa TaxID=46433 RepID=X6NZF0_RETFI|nr:hypothetical protein RFI_06457 [Reticulomyxa filosa]|eukprot:ETO30662.1 hypothetical protein RFI_06457 [Reticulomyxa filosa]
MQMGQIYDRLAIGDSECSLFKNQNGNATLEHVQIYRLAWHLIGVVLSLPQSPLSILFHNPMAYANQYLLAMPEDQSASLLRAMAGSGAWLCPNNHLYFVTDCTATNESAKCPTCGDAIGNEAGKGFHNAAKGNRRIGVVQDDGTIYPDKNGATQGMEEYRPELMAPQGYVILEGAVDDKCRRFNETSIRIARLFVNLILLIHHTNAERSDCLQFTKLGKSNTEVMNKLFKIVQRYLEKIATMIGESFEGTLLLLHYMIHCIYMKFETRFPNGFLDLSLQGRQNFEKYLLEECIDPVIQNKDVMIRLVRAQTVSQEECRYWGKRVEEDMKPDSDEFKQFRETYLPNVYLPYRIVTLTEFRHFVFQSPSNEKKYPVIWGILKTISSASGFSTFALQYLPAMIQWMKLVHSRFNCRLTQEEVEERPQEFSAEYALQKQWGEKTKFDDTWKSFVQGWNHVASRITTDHQKSGSRIRGSGQEPAENEQKEEEKKGDDEKYEKRNNNNTQVLDVGTDEYKRYLVLADALNQCENISFQCIKANNPNDELSAKEVPLWMAIDCGSTGPLATSKMIRLLLEHLMEFKIKRYKYLRLNATEENALATHTLGEILLTHISSEKDVVGIDETKFLQEIQECTSQKFEYGTNVPFAVNLRLLESRMKDNYIVGRKIIKFTLSELMFELAGQHDIRQVIVHITAKYNEVKNTIAKQEYFQRVGQELLKDLKLEIDQRADIAIGGNIAQNTGGQIANANSVIAFKVAKQCIRANLPDNNCAVGAYMKDILHLQQAEFEPFVQVQELRLAHCEDLWKYLERLHLYTENVWHKIPRKLMNLYQTKVPAPLKPVLQNFVVESDLNLMWELLIQWKQFLETKLSRETYQKASSVPLKEYLGTAMSNERLEEQVQKLPDNLFLIHAGTGYEICAQMFQERGMPSMNNN